MPRLRELLIELKDDRVLLMGDFNYPGVDWMSGECKGASQEGTMFVECFEDNFYEQYVKEPTRGGGQYPGLGYYKRARADGRCVFGGGIGF